MELEALLPSLSRLSLLPHLRDLGIAYAMAFVIGWNREQWGRGAGLRTFPLVAIAACGFVQASENLVQRDPEAMARIVEGVIGGIGFIGGGAILKTRASVHGTATAASIWSTGALGAAVGHGLFETALVLSLVNFATLRWLGGLKQHLRRRTEADGAPEDEGDGLEP